MRVRTSGGGIFMMASVLVASLACFSNPAHARSRHPAAIPTRHANHAATASARHEGGHRLVRLAGYSHSGSKRFLAKGGKAHYPRYAGLQCVPFAREASGIDLKGNAANWWDAAQGVYARGSRPEPGSVLNFRATGRMQLGHVAVVTNVVGSREIEIEHAHWAGGGVERGVSVQDVSENNDWSAVRVSLGRGAEYGSVYPTYGFIYDRPDSGTMMANASGTAGLIHDVSTTSYDEVAEAPEEPRARRRRATVHGTLHAKIIHKRRHHVS